jgi:hypothetical protein
MKLTLANIEEFAPIVVAFAILLGGTAATLASIPDSFRIIALFFTR